ncbi:MAG: hypothetical protein HRT90_06710 [Candidatus Margulisbacteria bacterium]|nr:hypothetical protein [Candidatus Margulisiibacteriota bacterium]
MADYISALSATQLSQSQASRLAKPVPMALNTPPFQLLMDHAVSAFASLSSMEAENNRLIKRYLRGKATVDEVSVSTSKLNLAMQLATTVLTTSVQTFTQLQNTPL